MYQGDYDKYILFFAGRASYPSVQEEMDKYKYNKLFSQLNERKEILNTVDRLRHEPGYDIKLFVDSGAYSAFTKGRVVDIDDYINFINETGDVVFVFAALDVIGTGSIETELEAPKKSWDNYLYMIERVKPEYRDKIMPVYHANEDFKWLKNMLEYTFPDTGEHIKYIGLGALTESNARQRKEWSDMCFSIIHASSNPNVMTHAFGCTQLDVCETTPFTSSDSTSWIQISTYGQILVDRKPVVIGARMKHRVDHIQNKPKNVQDHVKEVIAKYGFTIEDLEDSIENRQLYHLRMYKDWEDHYKFKGERKHKKMLFSNKKV